MTRYAALAVLLMAYSAEAIEDGQSYVRLSPDARAAYIRGVVDTLIVDAMDEARHGDFAANLLLRCRKERAPRYSAVRRIAEDLLKIDPHVPMPLVISGAMGEACSRVLPPNSGLE